MLAHAETQRVYGAARESHNKQTRNSLKHSTCSHKQWETRKGSMFGVKPYIPAPRGARWWFGVAPAEKASLLGSQFDSKQCREQFMTPLSCFHGLGVILWPSGLLSFCVCFFILIHMLVLILWVCFLYF